VSVKAVHAKQYALFVRAASEGGKRNEHSDSAAFWFCVLRENWAANKMAKREWEQFYSVMVDDLKRDCPDLYAAFSRRITTQELDSQTANA
jgi:hypothetical protein